MTVIFAKTRQHYDSYTDFWALVSLSGYDTCYVDEIDPDRADVTYIVTFKNAEWEQGWNAPKARIIHFNFEWYVDAPVKGIREVWSPDPVFARMHHLRHVAIGSHAGLRMTESAREQFEYDFAFLAYMTGRRRAAYEVLENAFYRLSPTSAWGAERDRILNASRFYLHVHQEDRAPYMPALRLVVAAAYKMPFIGEKPLAQSDEYGLYGSCYIPFAKVTPVILDWDLLKSDQLSTALGELAYETLCVQNNFRQTIERAL